MTADYCYESFLPYRHALFLERSIAGILRVENAKLKGCRSVYEGILDALGFSARVVFEDLRPFGMGENEFQEMRKKEESRKNMTEDERLEEIESEAESLRELIDSGEIDIWDDAYKFAEIGEALTYSRSVYQAIDSKIVPHLKPGDALFDKLVVESMDAIKAGDGHGMKTFRAALTAWDYGRMHHEGEPPFKIRFSQQVADELGIDAELESARMGHMGQVSSEDLRRISAALRVVWAGRPKLGLELKHALSLSGIQVAPKFFI